MKQIAFLKECAHCLCAVLLALCMGFVAWHLPRWTKAIDLTLKHVDEAAGETARAMKHLATASNASQQTSAQALDRITELAGTVGTATAMLDQAGKSLRTMDQTMIAGEELIKSTRVHLDQFSLEIGETLASTRKGLDAIAPTLEAGGRTFDAATELMRNEDLLATLGDARKTAGSLSRIAEDSQKKWHSLLYPEVDHSRWRYLKTGWAIVKTPLSLSEPAYYVRGVLGK